MYITLNIITMKTCFCDEFDDICIDSQIWVFIYIYLVKHIKLFDLGQSLNLNICWMKLGNNIARRHSKGDKKHQGTFYFDGLVSYAQAYYLLNHE